MHGQLTPKARREHSFSLPINLCIHLCKGTERTSGMFITLHLQCSILNRPGRKDQCSWCPAECEVLHLLSHLVPFSQLGHKYYSPSHFTDEEV